jgi:UDP-N-acetylglucosamine acyltransferase
MADIHPTAIVDPNARLADSVIVGPYCVVESDVTIGEGTELRPGAVIRRHTTLGEGNLVDSFCVLGGLPQDLKFDPATVSHLRIGDGNVFREGVTISRATTPGGATVVGSKAYWMTQSHAGHDSTIGDGAIITNNASIAGHVTIGPRAILSANVLIHQFTWVGEMVMTRGNSAASMHVPPYTLLAKVNYIAGLNAVGLRRAPDISDEDRKQVKEAFRITYRAGLNAQRALEKLDEWADMGAAAGKFREFLRKVVTAEPPFDRGLCAYRPERKRD